MNDDRYLTPVGPPSSPPNVYKVKISISKLKINVLTTLLRPRIMKQMQEVMRNSMTEKARLPGGVSNFFPYLL